jgi:hypothetical protein
VKVTEFTVTLVDDTSNFVIYTILLLLPCTILAAATAAVLNVTSAVAGLLKKRNNTETISV